MYVLWCVKGALGIFYSSLKLKEPNVLLLCASAKVLFPCSMTKYNNPNEIFLCLFVKLFDMTFASLGQEIRIFVTWSRNQERQQTQNEKTCLLLEVYLVQVSNFIFPGFLLKALKTMLLYCGITMAIFLTKRQGIFTLDFVKKVHFMKIFNIQLYTLVHNIS